MTRAPASSIEIGFATMPFGAVLGLRSYAPFPGDFDAAGDRRPGRACLDLALEIRCPDRKMKPGHGRVIDAQNRHR